MKSTGQPYCNTPLGEGAAPYPRVTRSATLWCERCAQESLTSDAAVPSPWMYLKRAALHR